MSPDETQYGDDNNGNGGNPYSDRRRSDINLMVAQQLERTRSDLGRLSRDVEGLRNDMGRLRDAMATDARAGEWRTYLIQRLDERMGELTERMDERIRDANGRLSKIENAYVTRDAMKEEVAPIWKWSGAVGLALIGALVTWLTTMLQGKGH